MNENFPTPEKFNAIFKEYFGCTYDEARDMAETDEYAGWYFREVLHQYCSVKIEPPPGHSEWEAS